MIEQDSIPEPAPQEAIAAALRRERARAGLSLTEVARRAGVAKSTLSQLESGSGNPSIETLWALCIALGIQFSSLLDPPRPQVRVVRAGQGAVLASAQGDYRVTLLDACPPNVRRDLFRITAEPGHPRDSEPHLRGVVEHVVLAAGRAMVGLTDSPTELLPGDYICYPGDRPHIFEALEPGTWGMLINDYS